MSSKALVTGGAGFIGSHLVDTLLEKSHRVRVIDNLEPQVHGRSGRKPLYLSSEAEFIKADINNKSALKRALKGVEVIFHMASAVGVGQSMYQIRKYTYANDVGTANLLELITQTKNKVKKIVVSSSMSIYGEGRYRCPRCGDFYPEQRSSKQIQKRLWEMRCPKCNKESVPFPTNEDKPLFPQSIYAINKSSQEQMCLAIGSAYKIPTVALRYFNAYGSRQSLSNPYTGVLAIFSCRVLNNKPPIIFEDGLQSRDFIHVKDIVKANILAMEKKQADYEVFNIGTGLRTTLVKLADVLIKAINPKLKMQITNKFREGDTRHCFADITKIKKKLGFSPGVKLERGLKDLLDWLKTQKARDKISKMNLELKKRGLVS
ncbi:MAG: NAD-dependent epimerase/dehydratase family protein [Candidatus Omnitrophica bacterium]|nr:NAD-dependent epimerase/dehydratase family protein [Candidatus Omnitrophota bacterium]